MRLNVEKTVSDVDLRQPSPELSSAQEAIEKKAEASHHSGRGAKVREKTCKAMQADLLMPSTCRLKGLPTSCRQCLLHAVGAQA